MKKYKNIQNIINFNENKSENKPDTIITTVDNAIRLMALSIDKVIEVNNNKVKELPQQKQKELPQQKQKELPQQTQE